MKIRMAEWSARNVLDEGMESPGAYGIHRCQAKMRMLADGQRGVKSTCTAL
jgi:hypothetical protein